MAALPDAGRPSESPLRRARLRVGWTQAATMHRFEEAVRSIGERAPTGASLKRMFAYWESGERAVTVEAYRRAFVMIYQAPYEALGFAPSDETGRIAILREGPELYDVDQGLVALFESQTQNLRMLDRRLGTAALMQQTEMHVTQMEAVLQNSVGGRRTELAAALAAAAGLAGWQALDQGSIQRAWQLHNVARSAARESENPTLLAHVTAQSAYVLLDASQSNLALQRIQSAAQALGSRSPRLLSVWLAAAEAEAAAAVGNESHAQRQLDEAYALLPDGDDAGELPYLMLDEKHLARWRGHCLARLGKLEAIDYLNVALERVGDSVRAATGLHVDLAHAHRQAGQLVEAREQVKTAIDLAGRFGSRRQQNRLRALLPTTEG